ncbi:MAG: DUF4179 domain-containing protein [Peptococcaceae bacterium]
MEKLEDLLNREKDFLAGLPAPDGLESRLRKGLTKAKPRTKRGVIAAAVIFFVLFTYHYDAIAYYGKKLMGYDEVMSGTLKDLNQLGKGQEIDQSVAFSNGTIVTLQGIMFDDNRLIAFFSLKAENGNVDDLNLLSREMKGLFQTYHPTSGQGVYNEAEKEIKWVQNFDPPAFYERTLTFQFSLSVKGKFIGQDSISFKLDRSKAMGSTIKQKINKTLNLDGQRVNFAAITASPTMTVVEGTIVMPAETRENLKSSRNLRIGLDYDLLANGQEITGMGGGMRGTPLGHSFQGRFGPLPEDIKSLQIRLNHLPYSQDVQEAASIDYHTENYMLQAAGNDIFLKKLSGKDDSSYLTVVTEDDVLLEKVYLVIDGRKVSVEKTIAGKNEKQPDGRITYERTLEFSGRGEKYELLIERISYTKEYQEIINIPING